VYLNLLPSKIPEIDLVKIPIEMRIANKLRDI
jgi:hypothetical protein